ncbi:succinyl-diaminopimelate desuccinylase [Buchnera aphidicola (Melanaphis sacchari)]|uniref:Succinyl-diaminopimelate desuccinylase n=1 Tax=Buchnera aphidicola (Melanaphis sacchari) TaxID=2173854 RepID=A0A2U8DFT4_9GAMM|nr:succinyl-diaminopimelate desuccinylase [Buchnera aphidicola]AWH90669.1 succinyl-diaminopimelate desuccinylase [Buchnera aphidicola (Melanaphis sacchari)]
MISSIVELTKKLIRIPSISPQDLGCQDIMIDFFRNLDFKVTRVNVNNTKNFWATRGSGKTLAFAGHTDVVSPGEYSQWTNNPFDPVINHGFLFGRGASDMKGALAAMMIASERFIKKFPLYQGRLAFLITSDEESSALDGTKKVVDYLISKNDKIDYCIVGEPSSNVTIGDTIKNGRRGSITANLKIYGIQGHIAYPQLADNPIHKSLPIILKLLSVKLDHGDHFFSPSIVNISNIHSGEGSNNVIPGSLFVQFNFRFGISISENEIKSRFVKILKDSNINYSLEWYISGKPFLTKNGLLINKTIQSIKEFNDVQPILSTDGGTSDGRFIALMKSEIVELGLTNNSIHKINECVKVSDLKKLSLIYESIMKNLLVNIS